MKTAQLKQKACIEDIDYAARRGLDKGQMAHLAGGDWIRFQQNLILTGGMRTVPSPCPGSGRCDPIRLTFYWLETMSYPLFFPQ